MTVAFQVGIYHRQKCDFKTGRPTKQHMNMLQVDIETNLHQNGIESARDMEETMRANRISNCISPCRRYLNSLKEIKVHYDATEVQGNGQCILNRPMYWQLPT